MNDFADARPPAKRVHISRNVEKAGGEKHRKEAGRDVKYKDS